MTVVHPTVNKHVQCCGLGDYSNHSTLSFPISLKNKKYTYLMNKKIIEVGVPFLSWFIQTVFSTLKNTHTLCRDDSLFGRGRVTDMFNELFSMCVCSPFSCPKSTTPCILGRYHSSILGCFGTSILNFLLYMPIFIIKTPSNC